MMQHLHHPEKGEASGRVKVPDQRIAQYEQACRSGLRQTNQHGLD